MSFGPSGPSQLSCPCASLGSLMSNSPALPTDLQEPEIHSELETMRHSCAHIMAHAIQKLWPQAKFGIGPTVEDGFYYDVDLDVKLTPEDLPRIEKEMATIIKANQPFVRKEHPVAEALEQFKKLGPSRSKSSRR